MKNISIIFLVIVLIIVGCSTTIPISDEFERIKSSDFKQSKDIYEQVSSYLEVLSRYDPMKLSSKEKNIFNKIEELLFSSVEQHYSQNDDEIKALYKMHDAILSDKNGYRKKSATLGSTYKKLKNRINELRLIEKEAAIAERQKIIPIELINKDISEDSIYSFQIGYSGGGTAHFRVIDNIKRTTLELIHDNRPEFNLESKCINGLSVHFSFENLNNDNCKENIYLIPVFNILSKIGENSYNITTLDKDLITDFIYTYPKHLKPKDINAVLQTKRIGFSGAGTANFFIWVKYRGLLEGRDYRGFERSYLSFEEYVPD